MPLTKTGKAVLKKMQKEYGKKKGEEIFYATMKEKGMEKEWEGKTDCSEPPKIHKKLKFLPLPK